MGVVSMPKAIKRKSFRAIRRRPRGQIRNAKVAKVFTPRRTGDVHLARLSVLYEDLRIEIYGMRARSIGALDVLDPKCENTGEPQNIGRYRRYYFLRRSIATLREFSDCFHKLEQGPEFAVACKDAEAAPILRAATEFFKKNGQFLQRIRNDIGGHFGEKAAEYAVFNLDPNVVSKIELISDASGRPNDPRLHFAGEIAAAALARHLPGKDLQHEVEHLIQNVLIDAYTHATNVVQVFVATHLMSRFGK